MNRDAYYDESVSKIKLQEEKPSFIIRSLQVNETSLLRDFLYEAIFVPEGMNAPPRNVVDLPELQVYIQDFGSRIGDYSLVAESFGRVLGAVWVRLMNDYGHVDDQTPSLAISLYAAYRGKGIGTELLRAMLAYCTVKDIRRCLFRYRKQTLQLVYMNDWALKLCARRTKNM